MEMRMGLTLIEKAYGATAEECLKAMSITAAQVVQERRRMLANLISEVVTTAPEEEEDPVEVFRSLSQALQQGMRGAGGGMRRRS